MTRDKTRWLVNMFLLLAFSALARQAASPTASAEPNAPLEVQGYSLSGDGLADPGETLSMTVTLINNSEDELQGVQAALSSTSSHVTLTHTSPITYGNIASGQIKAAPQPFGFQIDDDAPRGQIVAFTLTLSATAAGPWLHKLSLPVGGWYVRLPLVLHDYIRERIPNDERYPMQWALPKIQAPKAWRINTGDPSIVIAIVDSGIDLDHPDLENKLWLNTGEIPSNGQDDDGNGFIDDVHGYDFWNDDPDPDDDHYYGHGSHVAGIAAAATDNWIGVAALGWNSTLMSLKTQNSSGVGTTNELGEAIVYAVDNGASVINISVGQELTMCPSTLQAAINYADSHGVLVIAAVGNQDYDPNKDFYPAACNNVLGVAATAWWDGRIGADNGPYVDVVAPGHDIYSTLRGGTYGYASGASMASPLVAGLAALLRARYPGYGDEETAWAILSHAIDLGDPGKDHAYGWGRINAYQAVAQGATGTPAYELGSARKESTDWGLFAPGELLVGLRPAPCKVGGMALDAIPHLGVWRVAVPVGQELARLEMWRSSSCLAFVEPNYLIGTVP